MLFVASCGQGSLDINPQVPTRSSEEGGEDENSDNQKTEQAEGCFKEDEH